jgi:hypothetical protein
VLHLHSGGEAKALAGNVRGGADPGGGEIKFAGSRFGGGHKLRHGFEAFARRRHQHARLRSEHCDRFEVAQLVVRQRPVQDHCGAHRGRAEKERVTVRFGANHRGDADNAAAAGPVLDHESLPDLLADLVEYEPRHDVVGAARGERADNQHRTGWPVLGSRVLRQSRAGEADRRQHSNKYKVMCRSRLHLGVIVI